MENNKASFYLKVAIQLSEAAADQHQGGPFGCVIVKDGKIVGTGSNQVLASGDPTAHAEVVAIRNACQQLGTPHLNDCVLYTSCEPCPMCLAAIYWAHIDRVYYCNTRQDAASIGFDDARIYKEIALDPEDRAIPMEHVPSAHALNVFTRWQQRDDKNLY